MAKIEVGRFSELMRRYLSMAGVVQVSQELAPEISPVFVLEQERPDWEYIKNQKLCSSQISIAGVANQWPVGRLRNPIGSGVIATISAFNFSSPEGSINPTVVIYRRELNVDLANIVGTVTRDTRWPALNVSSLIASQETVTPPIVGDFFYNAWGTSSGTTWLPLIFVLTPGNIVDFVLENTLMGFRSNMHWLERRMGELERAT